MRDSHQVEIRVEGIFGVEDAITSFRPHVVLSIGANDEDVPRCLVSICEKTCRLSFADVTRAFREHRPPMAGDLIRTGDFLRKTFDANPDGARILIHCHAGVSRSPAMALFVLAFHDHWLGRKPSQERAEEIFSHMLEAAPNCLPHQGLLELIDTRFAGYGGAFHRLGQDMRQRIRSRHAANVMISIF